MPLTTYSYVVEPLNVNWPVVVSPASGSFSTVTGSMDIETELNFCASSGACSGITVLPYTSEACSSEILPFADVRIALNLPYSNTKLYGNNEHFECLECLAKPSVLIPPAINLDNVTLNTIDFPIPISGLNYNSIYNYVIELLDSNSLLGFNELSGTITTHTNNVEVINSKIIICENSAECSGYSTLGAVSNCLDTLPYGNIRIKITSNCLDYPVYSDKINIACNYCWPRIIFDIIENDSITDSNEYPFSFVINNLQPYQTYTYSITNIESNNIIAFESLSGSFTTDEGTDFISSSKIIFCDTSGYYNDYNIVNNSGNCDIINKYVKFNLTLDSSCLDNPVSSKNIKIECENCLPDRHSVLLSANSLYHVDEAIDITATINNTIPNHTYVYEFDNIDGNWPIKIYPPSGSFVADNDSSIILAQALFCCPSGNCSGTLFPKTYDSFKYKNNYLTQNIRLNVTDTCANDMKYDDANIFIQLKDIVIEPFDDVYNVVLDNTTNGCYNLNMNIKECINSHTYTYQYSAIDGNWPIILNNISGTFTNRSPNNIISTQISFCPSTGICNNLPGSISPTNVLNYGSILANNCNATNKFIKLQLSVYSNCYADQKVFSSQPITVYCEDCISTPSITSAIE